MLFWLKQNSIFFLNVLVGGQKKEPLPEDFAFFVSKINDRCAHVGSNEAGTRHLPYFSFCKFDKFEEVTLTNMKDTLRTAKNAL